MATTFRRGRTPAFAWSFSKLKNFETCPKRHYHYDIAKDVREEESDDLKYGNMVHEAFHKRLGPEKKPFSPEMAHLEPWAEQFDTGVGALLVEQKYAITETFEACEFFDRVKQVWFRGIGDVVRLVDPTGVDHLRQPAIAHIADWKTGKIKEDYVQLALMAQCLFSAYPTLKRVRTDFIWLAEDAVTEERFNREDMVALWAGLLPRVEQMKVAAERQEYPPKPSGLCKRYCGVETCPHHGVGR